MKGTDQLVEPLAVCTLEITVLAQPLRFPGFQLPEHGVQS